MRVFPLIPSALVALLLAGCAAPMSRGNGAAATPAPAGSASSRATALRDLVGEYDNHAQRGDGAPPASGFAPPPLHQWLRPTHAADALLWRLQQSSGTAASEGRWLLREEGAALVPYRPLNAAANAAFDDKGASYRFQAADWAPLGPARCNVGAAVSTTAWTPPPAAHCCPASAPRRRCCRNA